MPLILIHSFFSILPKIIALGVSFSLGYFLAFDAVLNLRRCSYSKEFLNRRGVGLTWTLKFQIPCIIIGLLPLLSVLGYFIFFSSIDSSSFIYHLYVALIANVPAVIISMLLNIKKVRGLRDTKISNTIFRFGAFDRMFLVPIDDLFDYMLHKKLEEIVKEYGNDLSFYSTIINHHLAIKTNKSKVTSFKRRSSKKDDPFDYLVVYVKCFGFTFLKDYFPIRKKRGLKSIILHFSESF